MAVLAFGIYFAIACLVGEILTEWVRKFTQ